MTVSPVDSTNALDFMLLRPPEPVDPLVMRRHYIQDGDLLTSPGMLTNIPDPPTLPNYSPVGSLVFKAVYAASPPANPEAELRDALLTMIGASVFSPAVGDTRKKLRLEDLSERAVYWRGDEAFVLPDTIGQLGAPLITGLAVFRARLAQLSPSADGTVLAGVARELFFPASDLRSVVFTDQGAHSNAFVETKRTLFDSLYLLYLMRRWMSVDMADIISGLRLLHLLEALAVDEVIDAAVAGVAAGAVSPALGVQVNSLARRFPSLVRWLRSLVGSATPARPPGFPLVRTAQEWLLARPVVHPIFAQLWRFRTPFNDLKPVGVGDFKVVKQWLVEYIPGEICDIHNVMKSETKERIHRRLERSEDTFSFSIEAQEETTRDTQTTDRFELKREIEATLKTDLNVNANASVSYNQMPVVATVSGGFAYNRSDGSSEKLAQSLSREVVAKAVSRVQTRTAQARSSTKLFETEETNKHLLAAPTAHVSGIYRWVDKHYRAQVFNFGRRMMFELILPEPADFFVTARLAEYVDALEYPKKPADPKYLSTAMPITGPEALTRLKFDELRRTYDLASFTYPVTEKTYAVVDAGTNAAMLKESGIDGSDKWHAAALHCSLKGATGYTVTRIRVTGMVEFDDQNSTTSPVPEPDRNLARMDIDGTTVWFKEDWRKYGYIDERTVFAPANPYTFSRDDVDVVLAFNDTEAYRLIISLELTLSAERLLDWQTEVYRTILDAETKRVDDANRDVKIRYDAELATYSGRIAELKATAVADLLRGRSEQANQNLIRTELRRQCLTMITKELGSKASDDFLTTWDPTGTRTVTRAVTRLDISENVGGGTNVQWKTTGVATELSVPDVEKAKARGRHVQFLEQAFDWDNLAWVFYPYFWAPPSTWVQRLAREDETDPNLTAFLQAGAARVLFAVTPAYDEAVLHYLCTREPWEGGAAPVIGDKLYLPLHEELRRQQDDRYGAIPEGEPWDFTVPTMLTYLHGSGDSLPDLIAERAARAASQQPNP